MVKRHSRLIHFTAHPYPDFYNSLPINSFFSTTNCNGNPIKYTHPPPTPQPKQQPQQLRQAQLYSNNHSHPNPNPDHLWPQQFSNGC